MVIPKTNGMAVAAFVLSLVLGFVGSFAAIPMGFVSRARIKGSNGAETGAGFALAAIIIGFVNLGLIVVLVLFAFAIPTDVSISGSSSQDSGPSVADLTTQAKKQIVSTASDGFGVTGVVSVFCSPPVSWQPASKFTCLAYTSTHTELGEYDGTVEADAQDGSYQWNAEWVPSDKTQAY